MRQQQAAVVCLGLSLVGLAVCAYLWWLHLALLRGEIVGGLGCSAADPLFNCHAVTASPSSRVLGIPLASWGLVGYLAVGALALVAWRFTAWTATALAALLGLAVLFVTMDIALLFVMVTQLRVVCLLCLLTYGVNLALVGAAAWGMGQPWPQALRAIPKAWRVFCSSSREPVVWIVWMAVGVGAAGVAAGQGVEQGFTRGMLEAVRRQLTYYVQHEPRLTVDTASAPRRGAAGGAIQLVEFSDFLCSGCQQAAQFNAILLAGRRREVALFFKHFPLDAECNTTIRQTVHPGACRIAAATACAQEQGKFWEFHDLAFHRGPAYQAARLEIDAARLGLDLAAFRDCLASGRGLAVVKRDIADAERLQITSTPTYLVNGIPIQGTLTPAVFEEVVAVLREAPPPPPPDPRD